MEANTFLTILAILSPYLGFSPERQFQGVTFVDSEGQKIEIVGVLTYEDPCMFLSHELLHRPRMWWEAISSGCPKSRWKYGSPFWSLNPLMVMWFRYPSDIMLQDWTKWRKEGYKVTNPTISGPWAFRAAVTDQHLGNWGFSETTYRYVDGELDPDF
jgi:hypothetical protein